ncbi:MAG: ubiquinone biosynthesis protein UbiE [Candidatus Altiarchaeales archaeon]|nr:MAG: ubiquinone biosynthesis protein UbiE [Candidatus Altiarchaeales archaeon]
MNFDELADRYDSWYRTEFGRYADRLEKRLVLRFAEPKKGEKVLDVGCGTGTYGLEFSKMGLDVTCLDMSKRMLDIARKKSRDMNTILGNAREIPFKDNTFDLIVGITLIEFLDEPERAIKEMKRVLKREGRLILGVLNKFSLFALCERIRKNETYANARFYSIFELKKFGVKRWNSTLFASKKMPGFLLNFLRGLDRILSVIIKPFGAFLVVEIER